MRPLGKPHVLGEPLGTGRQGGTPALLDAPTLSSPADMALVEDLTPTISWNAVSGASTYEAQLATDVDFTSVVDSDTGIGTTSYTPGSDIDPAMLYWRVRADSPLGEWSTPRVMLVLPPATALWYAAQSVFEDDGNSDPAEDGDAVVRWYATNGTNYARDAAASKNTFETNELNGLPVVQFVGTDGSGGSRLRTIGAASSFLTVSAGTVFAVFKVSAISTDSANPYDNDAIWGDIGGQIGVHVRSTGPTLQFYNWDGNVDKAEIAISTGVWYIAEWRHESGTLYGSVNGSAYQSAASGNTSSLVNVLGFGDAFGDKRLGGQEAMLIFYNTALSSALRAAMWTALAAWFDITVP